MQTRVRWWLIALLVAAAIVWVSLTVATGAFAAGEGERVGENIGRLLSGWARSLYIGVAALVAIVFLLNRRFADLVVFLAAAVLVGGFVLAPAEVAGAIRGIRDTITG